MRKIFCSLVLLNSVSGLFAARPQVTDIDKCGIRVLLDAICNNPNPSTIDSNVLMFEFARCIGKHDDIKSINSGVVSACMEVNKTVKEDGVVDKKAFVLALSRLCFVAGDSLEAVAGELSDSENASTSSDK